MPGWDGWWQLEASSQVQDRLQATIQQRELWDEMAARSLSRAEGLCLDALLPDQQEDQRRSHQRHQAGADQDRLE